VLARIHADANRSGHRKPLKRLGRSAEAPFTQLKLGANLMVIVEDALQPKDNFSQGPPRFFWICWTNEGKLPQNPNVVNDAIAHTQGGFRILSGDVGANVVQVRNRSLAQATFSRAVFPKAQ